METKNGNVKWNVLDGIPVFPSAQKPTFAIWNACARINEFLNKLHLPFLPSVLVLIVALCESISLQYFLVLNRQSSGTSTAKWPSVCKGHAMRFDFCNL